MPQSFPKTLILGIDGLSLTLARKLAAKGIFKHLSSVINSPQTVATRSELPEVSPVNWASFFTGKGPEEHGIYGFTDMNPVSYQTFLTDYSHLRCPAVWDRLGMTCLTSKIINLPCTYPAPQIRGMLVSGFIAHDLKHAVYPRAILPMIQRMGYRLEADTCRGLHNPSELLDDISQTIQSRLRLFEFFWPDLSWDLFIIVLTELDRISHFLQQAIEDEKHPLHHKCMTVLSQLDLAAGRILERYYDLPQPARLAVVADHGFTRLKTEVDINTFLRLEGFLKIAREPQNELDLGCMDHSSLAFALDPGRIYIHDSSRFARGRLNKKDYHPVRNLIQQKLLGLDYHGTRVFKDVLPGEEIYPSGVGLPPDLLCVPEEGFDLKAKFDRKQVFGHFGRTGTHSPQDVFYYDSLGGKPGKIRNILECLDV